MTILYILQVVFGIGILIFVHELGHFLVAKRCGVRVETFAIGFGPRLFGWRRNKDGKLVFNFGAMPLPEPGTEAHTDYRICLIPLGGYVKMAGEEPDENLTGAEWEFPSKTVGQRAAIIVAGVTFNAIFAFLAFIVAFQIGVRQTSTELGLVHYGQPAWEAGLDEGDIILERDGKKVEDFDDLATSAAFASEEKGLLLKIKRANQVFERRVFPRYDPHYGFQTLGIGLKTGLTVHSVLKLNKQLAPAKEAGILPDDRILGLAPFPIQSLRQLSSLLWSSPGELFAFVHTKTKKKVLLNAGHLTHLKYPPSELIFQGKKLQTWQEFRQLIAHHGDTPLPLRIQRNGKEKNIVVVPRLLPRWMIGVENGTPPRVRALRHGTLAAKYLEKDDLILKINHKKITNVAELAPATKNLTNSFTITLQRGEKQLQLAIPLSELQTHWLLSKEYAQWSNNLTLRYVRPISFARTVFQPGDRLLAINGQKVSSPQELQKSLAKPWDQGTVQFTIQRENTTFTSRTIPLEKLLELFWEDGVFFGSSTKIGKVMAQFPAAKAGMLPGDVIQSIGGVPVHSWSEMAAALQQFPAKPVEIVIKRDGKEITLQLTPLHQGLLVKQKPTGKLGNILQAGDRIQAIDGEIVYSWQTFADALLRPKGKKVFSIYRKNQMLTITSKEKWTEQDLLAVRPWEIASEPEAKIGLRPKTERVLKQEKGLLASIALGFKKSWIITKRILLTLKSLLSAQVSAKNLGGPVLIAQASYSLAKLGIGTLLYFLGLLSLNLAVLNLLPIPILDGGHLVFLAIEKIKGSKVSERAQIIANYIGLAILLCLMLFVTYNDILRLFR
ncbi:MAG: RIP metalloprotease RseP [Planctomycetota bacterium]|nr:MAG: RIP metalloprotease RseP [Planctomycetota bacterium]